MARTLESIQQVNQVVSYDGQAIGVWQRGVRQSSFNYEVTWLRKAAPLPLLLALPLQDTAMVCANTHPFLQATQSLSSIDEEYYRSRCQLINQRLMSLPDAQFLKQLGQVLNLYTVKSLPVQLYDFEPLHDVMQVNPRKLQWQRIFAWVKHCSLVPARDKQVWLNFFLFKYLISDSWLRPQEVVVQLDKQGLNWVFLPFALQSAPINRQPEHNTQANALVQLCLYENEISVWTNDDLEQLFNAIQVKRKYVSELWQDNIDKLWQQRQPLLNDLANSNAQTRRIQGLFKVMDYQRAQLIKML